MWQLWFLRVAAQHRNQTSLSLPFATQLHAATPASKRRDVLDMSEHTRPWPLIPWHLSLTRVLRVSSPILSRLLKLDPLDREPILTLVILKWAIVTLVDICVWWLHARLIAWLSRHLEVLVSSLLGMSDVVGLRLRLWQALVIDLVDISEFFLALLPCLVNHL